MEDALQTSGVEERVNGLAELDPSFLERAIRKRRRMEVAFETAVAIEGSHFRRGYRSARALDDADDQREGTDECALGREGEARADVRKREEVAVADHRRRLP